jgi:hypothetical protein
MSDIANGVIQVLDQLKGSGQLNDYLIDDDERKWTKLVYDIMVNKFDMPFGKGTMQQASDIFNNAVRIWKGKNKLGNMMNMESKQTNKKLIRLTESDLHNIVKESVNKILTELDWKTLANAEKKARERGNTSYWRERGDNSPKGSKGYWDLIDKASNQRLRADRFGNAAKDAFNRDFGYQQGKPYDNDYQRVGMGGDFGSTEEFSPHAVGYKSKGYGNPKKYEFGRDNETFKRVSPEEFYQDNTDAAQAFRNADAEIKNYKKGNYDYQSGKGWQLKK